MLSFDEAQDRLLSAVEPLAIERVRLTEALGRHAVHDILARRTQPPFAASAMDGYAIRFADLPGPWHLIGESSAGHRFARSVESGQAVRIFTGAPLPDGADTVVVQEDVERDGDRVRLRRDGPAHRGAHIRAAGLDFGHGDRLISAGTRLMPPHIGLLASGGYAETFAHRRPRIALLSTGDELVAAGETPGADQIVNANAPMLASVFAAAGAEVVDLGIVPDDRTAITAAIDHARDVDLLVTIGGASVGDHDLVLPVLQDKGAVIDFWKVAIKPGKPILTGALGRTRVIGLPGNPVSAFVCAHLFVMPVLRRMGGDPSPRAVLIRARTATQLDANGPRLDHLRAVLAWQGDAFEVCAAIRQDSSMLRILAESNALIVRPEGASAAEVGDFVPVMPLDSRIVAP